MRELKESSGINIDYTSRTVTLIGDDTIDLIFTDVLGDKRLGADDVTDVALTIVKVYNPGYVDDGVGMPWSLGSMPEDIDYLMTKMPDSFEYVQIVSDGGDQHGPV